MQQKSLINEQEKNEGLIELSISEYIGFSEKEITEMLENDIDK